MANEPRSPKHSPESHQGGDIRSTSVFFTPPRIQLFSPNSWLPSPTPRTMEDASDDEDGKDEMKELLDEDARDLEAQKAEPEQPPLAAEYLVSTRVKLACLAGYFMLNLCLTIYNKAVLGKFPYPWLITTLHTSFGAAGCSILLARGYFKLSRLTMRSHAILVAFSFLYTINIAISNVSLYVRTDAERQSRSTNSFIASAMVSVPFHQIARSTCPIVTIVIYRIFYSRSYSTGTYLSLIPIIFGVGMATYGDYYFTTMGLVLTFFGVLLASVKVDRNVTLAHVQAQLTYSRLS